MLTIGSIVLMVVTAACPAGAVKSCTLSGCVNAKMECYYPGWGPCECYQWACPTGASCNDGNPLTYRDTCNEAHQCAGAAVPFGVAFYDSMTKCRRYGALEPSNLGAAIRVARNEFEGFQLAVHANTSYAYTVSVTAPSSAAGNQLWSNLYREHFDFLSNASGPDGAPGWWPDRLIPKFDDLNGIDYVDTDGGVAFPYLPAANENTVAFVELHAGQSQEAARYQGSLTISWSEGAQGPYTATWPITVDVEPFAIPSTSSLPTLYRRGAARICDAHGAAAGSSDCVNLLLKYAQFTLDHRLSVDLDEWPDGSFSIRYQHYLNGTNGPPVDPRRSPRLWNAMPRTTAAYTDRANQSERLATWMDLMRAGPVPSGTPSWLERAVLYWCDEPSARGAQDCPEWPSSVVSAASTAHPPSGAWLRQVVTTNHAFARDVLGESYSSSIDIITPNIIHIQAPGSSLFPTFELNQYADPYLTGSSLKSLWWYQANDTAAYGNSSPDAAPFQSYPQLGIDVHGVKNRAMPWLTFEMAPTRAGLGIRGDLYWDTVAAYIPGGVISQDALFARHLQNGDGNLMYPGRGRPLPSLRLKNLRDGMEDYEYLHLVATMVPNGTDCARSIARTAFRTARDVQATSAQGVRQQREFAASMIRSPSQPCPLVGW